jgi:hypothetical protein
MTKPVFFSIILLCISLFLSFLNVKYESFIGSPDALKCGIDMPPCSFGKSCLNGWCVDSTPPKVPQSTGLPVFP